MNIDGRLAELLNSPVGASDGFDEAIFLLSTLDILKAVVGIAVLLGAIQAAEGELLGDRLTLPRAVIATLLSVFTVRVSQEVLPFRARPIVDPSLDITAASAFGEPSMEALQTTSAFPSDHAALMFSLVVAVWFVNRRAAGWLAAWSVVGVLLPRVYLGIHFPGDVLAGGLLGAVLTYGLMRLPAPDVLRRGVAWLRARPGLSIAVVFAISYQISVLFIDARIVLDAIGL